MVGWYDAVEKGDALRYGGYQDLALNKLDALSYSSDWNGNLQICVAYRDAEGQLYHHVPRNDSVRKRLSPVYKTLPGWSEDISDVRHFADLPENAKIYLAGCSSPSLMWPTTATIIKHSFQIYAILALAQSRTKLLKMLLT